MTSPAHPNTDKHQRGGPRGIQSIEVGGALLTALVHHGRPLALKDLAREAAMAPAKAHPYLVSFIKLGLVEQEAVSGRYGLGPLALQLGLISLQQYDPVRLATPRIEELAMQLGHTVAIAVWGNRGPTIVRVAEAPSPVHISMRHGTVMGLRGTASGRLFAAHLPTDLVLSALAAEAPQQAAAAPKIDAQFAALLALARKDGLASAHDGIVLGVSALAAPVFDDQGRIALSLTAIGPSGNFDLNLHGPIALALKSASTDLSRQLGWREPAQS
ncbi:MULTISPECIES: IclR family transcriptional regulator [Roseateles]|uniref:IclR family transcriptional regulator n=1 Tax=Roseateles albus TaxID=2987525 RepID=A0ABT5KLM5_9BURK|nr:MULTISPECIES: IclR family transcriptional regulator [Roseateles]MCV2361431.1 IclR family transcriptional regulator [Paucibacter sp. TC2R-5]MDC8773835.1 IclR family transcriptional regulator [Roseateles albus]